MELKLSNGVKPVAKLSPFNRTIVELKLQKKYKEINDELSFNRTIVELKSP